MLICNALVCILLFTLVYEHDAYNWTNNTDVYDNGLDYDSDIYLDDAEGNFQETALRRYKRSSNFYSQM